MIRKIPDDPGDRMPAQEASRHLCIKGYAPSTCVSGVWGGPGHAGQNRDEGGLRPREGGD